MAACKTKKMLLPNELLNDRRGQFTTTVQFIHLTQQTFMSTANTVAPLVLFSTNLRANVSSVCTLITESGECNHKLKYVS